MTTTDRPCVICTGPRDARGQAPISTSGYACDHCQQRLDARLADLPSWYADARHLLLPGSSGGAGGKSSERSIGVRVAALDISNGREWVDVLHGWERVVREERQLAAVPLWVGGTDPVGATLGRLVAFLRTHLDWLCAEFAAVDDFAGEIDRLWRQGRALEGTQRESRYRVACPTEGCGKQITVGADDIAGTVVCRYCGAERTVEFLMRAADGEHWADAEALEARFGVSTRTLRRWAARGDVRRRNGLYCVEDVVARTDGGNVDTA